jgi:hypothetical protein
VSDRDRFSASIVERYIELGLAVGRHIDGFVDAYYGPPDLAIRIRLEPIRSPDELVFEAKALLGSIDAGEPLEETEGSSEEVSKRRRWIRAQVLGVLTTARILSGESISYSDEVELCYGVRPRRMDESAVLASHRDLDEVVPGSGLLVDRLIAWREAQAIPPDKLKAVIGSLTEDLRERTGNFFGLPDGESVEFEFVTNKPWAGFNYYLGELKSRVAINLDLPVLSTTIAHVVAHESYPGHHTEHSRKEVGLVRKKHWAEESIFLVGTPQCLVSEGLADLGLEIVVGRRPEQVIGEHLRALGIPYDPDVVAVIAEATEAQSAIRNEAALRLHEDRIDPEIVIQEVERFALLPKPRAAKLVEFLVDSTWRGYMTCYVEGLPLCRDFVGGKPDRFERLITEQITPADLIETGTTRGTSSL